MRILGIESSCDETAAAIIKISGSLSSGFKIKVESQAVWSQILVHKQKELVMMKIRVMNLIQIIQLMGQQSGQTYYLLTLGQEYAN